MDYNKGIIKMKVRSRLNQTFIGIIQDIPDAGFKSEKNTLMVQQSNGLTIYEQFYNVFFKIVLEYVPRDNENPLIKAIRMLPGAIKNAQRIKHNNDILKCQNEILDKFFYSPGDDNIKTKLAELESEINQLIDDNDIEILEQLLSRFDERMRSGILADLERLS